jgi:uncharacterized protein YuzE
MRIRYFPDTDTAQVEFSSQDIFETKEISENFYVDVDLEGNLVSMTIEHARKNANIQEVAFEQILGKPT